LEAKSARVFLCAFFHASRSRNTGDKFPVGRAFPAGEAIVFKEESAKDSVQSHRHDGRCEIFDM
jgi:hypothetical protein